VLWGVQEPTSNVTGRLLGNSAGWLVTALEAAERVRAGGEHDDGGGQLAQYLVLSPDALIQQHASFAGYETALIPATHQ
jgi:hypothetical protein